MIVKEITHFFSNINYKKHYHVIVLFVIACFVSFYYYTGFIASDDIGTYIPNFYNLINNSPLKEPIRLPVLITMAISYKLFGNNLESLPVLFTFIYPTLVICVYTISYITTNKTTAILSSILLIGCSTFYIYGGTTLPDNIGTLNIAISYIFFLLYFKNENHRDHFIFISMFFAFLAYLTKETYILSFIGYLPLMFNYQRNIKFLLKLTVKAFIFFLIIFFIYKLSLMFLGYGFNITSIDSSEFIKRLIIWNEKRGTDTLLSHFNYTFKTITANNFNQILLIMTIVGFISSIIIKNFNLLAFSFSGLFYVIFMGGFSYSLSNFIGLPIQLRYFTPSFLFFTISVSMLINELTKKQPKIKTLIILLSMFLSMQNIIISSSNAGRIYYSQNLRNFNDAVIYLQNKIPGENIYYNDRSLSRYINFYKYKEENINFLYFDENNFDKILYKNALFISQNNLPSKLIEKAQFFAENNNYTLIIENVKTTSDKKTLLNSFLFNTFIPKEKISQSMQVGYFYNPNHTEFLIDNSNFENWQNNKLQSWQKRGKNSLPISKTYDSYNGNYAVRIYSTASNTNYIYKNISMDTNSDYTNIKFSVYSKTSNATFNIIVSIKDATGNTLYSTEIKSQSSFWEESYLIVPILKNTDTIQIVLQSIGEGSVIVDDLTSKIW